MATAQTTQTPITPRAHQGPRPLALHIATMTAFSMSSIAALPNLKNASSFWSDACREKAGALADAVAAAGERDFIAAVERECRERHHLFAEGVRRYRAFERPYREPQYSIAWQAGTTVLRDYGAAGSEAPAVMIVPSLVNRADVLDLGCGRSFTEALSARGFRPLLVDWDAPGPAERPFDLTDYITKRLEPALAAAIDINGGRPVAVAGYCMGGDLALALAARQPSRIAGLALLATPWDFHAGDKLQTDMLAASLPALEFAIDTLGELPVDVLQAMFTGLDPWMTPAKFIRFAKLDRTSPAAHLFVALEDWLNDGVPLVGGVARECLRGWYVDNTTAEEKWEIAGEPVRPGNIGVPTIAFVPGNDHIVPPASAGALAEAIPGCDARSVSAGHIGMVTGSRANELLIEPLSAWLRNVSSTRAGGTT